MKMAFGASALMLVAALAFSSSAYGLDLTGRWREDDAEGRTYFMRQVGDELFWLGEARGTWANVAHGQVKGGTATLKWADVPKYGADYRNSGELVLEIVSEDHVRVIRKTGGFGGSSWKRIKSERKERPVLRDYL